MLIDAMIAKTNKSVKIESSENNDSIENREDRMNADEIVEIACEH